MEPTKPRFRMAKYQNDGCGVIVDGRRCEHEKGHEGDHAFMTNLDLVPTDHLLFELKLRFDHIVWIGRKDPHVETINRLGAQVDMQSKWCGDAHVCLGLLAEAGGELIRWLQGEMSPFDG